MDGRSSIAWQIDTTHTRIQFCVRHMMISNVRGYFERFTGRVELDGQDLTRSSVVLQIEADSINTQDSLRDAHLKSPDFLDAERYPCLHFASKRLELSDAFHGRMVGDLTIRGITREVALAVEYAGIARSPWGRVSAGFTATARINREHWGLTWDQNLQTGGALVGNQVMIIIDLEILREDEAGWSSRDASSLARLPRLGRMREG